MKRTRDPSTADGPHMSAGQIDEFLARALIARLATTLNDEPRVTPMWYRWDGSSLWFETSPTFPNARILAENPRAAVTVDESLGGLRLRAVVMRGTVATISGPPNVIDDGVLAIYERYLEPAELETTGRAMLSGSRHVLFRLEPEHIVSWDTTQSDASARPQRSAAGPISSSPSQPE